MSVDFPEPDGPIIATNSPSLIERFISLSAEGDNLAWEKGHERWTKILDEMIWTFEQLQPDADWESQFHSGISDIDWKPYKTDKNGEVKLYEMIHGPNDTSHFDRKGYQAYSDRIDHGLQLFSMYFRSLWD
jgi:hypothetical protein